MRNVDRGIIHVPQYQRELNTRVPVFRGLILPSMVQVERSIIDVVSIREEENPPIMLSENYPSIDEQVDLLTKGILRSEKSAHALSVPGSANL